MRRPTLVSLALTASAVALTACSAPQTVVPSGQVAPQQPGQAQGLVDAPVGPTDAPSVAPSGSPTAGAPTASASPSPERPRFAYDVTAAQRVLTDGGYYVGPLDGRPGPVLRSAVMAFQKVNGLGADGTVGPATLKALAAPKRPVLKGSSPANRVEVDLTRQVLYVVEGGAISRIMPVSSGNGATYEQKDGGTARALTPVGHYTIQRRIVGERRADLGILYDPQYFYGGWAIHGSNSVPAGPASHGCVRVTRPDAKYLLDALRNGMAVYLYGGRHVFTAGSSAPGTSSPTGDTAGGTPTTGPSPTRTSSPRPSSSPTATRPSSSPSPTRTSPSPTRSSPTPSSSPTRAASPGASPTRRP